MWEFWRSSGKRGRRACASPDARGSFDAAGLASPDLSMDASMEGHPPISPIRRSMSPDKRSSDRTHVDFKDLKIPLEDLEEEDIELQSGSENEDAGAQLRKRVVEKHKLIIVLVGLPGRGKTFLCNKLCCYLNWLGHRTQHFNVGYYRRKQNTAKETQDAAFFDKDNPEGQEKRQQALREALDAMLSWLSSEHSQVAIFDATNTTEERRRFLISKFHGTWQYLFLESVCNDSEVLEANYRYKMMYSPDYRGVDVEAAMVDFQERIRRYEEVYETITDRNIHYIKLINMVTGRGHLDINRISGYIPGKIVFYLMQVCKAGMARTRKIWLSRHGESLYNTEGLLGGDSGISPQGWEYAKQLPDIIFDRLPLTFDSESIPVSIWNSTLKRTIETAEYLPFPKLRWKALDEIHAGQFDSYTYEQISKEYPDEFAARKANKLTYRYPNGESYLDVIQRLEPVMIEIERERECVLVIAHQAILRAMYGYFMNIPLHEIPTLEIPLHTVIELTPKADGTMTEERFDTGIPTTKELQQNVANGATKAETPWGTSPPPLSPAMEGRVQAAASLAGTDSFAIPQRPNSARGCGSESGSLPNSLSGSAQAMCRSLNDLRCQGKLPTPQVVPPLNQSKHWAEATSDGDNDPEDQRHIETSDECPPDNPLLQVKRHTRPSGLGP